MRVRTKLQVLLFMILEKCQALTADSLSTLAASCTVKPGMPRIGVENPVELHCLSGGQLRGDLYTCNSGT